MPNRERYNAALCRLFQRHHAISTPRGFQVVRGVARWSVEGLLRGIKSGNRAAGGYTAVEWYALSLDVCKAVEAYALSLREMRSR